MPLRFPPRARAALLAIPMLLLELLAQRPHATAAEAGFVSHPCPIEGQDNAVVLGTAGRFQAACLALSTPHDAGPWPAAAAGRVTGSSRFCPRAVLTVLDRSGAITVRFLPAPEGSFLADPAACCRAKEIAVDPSDGSVHIATAAPTGAQQTCFGNPVEGGYEDLYRWDGSELHFVESRRVEPDTVE